MEKMDYMDMMIIMNTTKQTANCKIYLNAILGKASNAVKCSMAFTFQNGEYSCYMCFLRWITLNECYKGV